MPLLGTAAMLLSFDVVEEAVAEHDDWHTHEHLPERLSIPGFLRGTRWVAVQGQPRYLVLYEVEDLDTLASEAYLERLNHPTPWTARMMSHYRAMRRGLCSVVASAGLGLGHLGLLIRFHADEAMAPRLDEWLRRDVLAALAGLPGIGSVHLLRGALAAPSTSEQRLRGSDAGVDRALLVTGYRQDALAGLAGSDLSDRRLADHGAAGVVSAIYRTDYTLVARELGPGGRSALQRTRMGP